VFLAILIIIFDVITSCDFLQIFNPFIMILRILEKQSDDAICISTMHCWLLDSIVPQITSKIELNGMIFDCLTLIVLFVHLILRYYFMELANEHLWCKHQHLLQIHIFLVIIHVKFWIFKDQIAKLIKPLVSFLIIWAV
jgi:hypothetical protein